MKDKSNENLIEGFAIADRNMAIERGDYKTELMRRLAKRDAVIRELVGAFRKERTISPCDFCFNDDGDMKGCVGGINDDVKCQWYEARATLARARDALKGQGEPKRGVLRFKKIARGISGVEYYGICQSDGNVSKEVNREFTNTQAKQFAQSLGLEAEFEETPDASD